MRYHVPTQMCPLATNANRHLRLRPSMDCFGRVIIPEYERLPAMESRLWTAIVSGCKVR